MEIRRVWAVFFTGTQTTERVVCIMAQQAAQLLGVPCEQYDFSTPQARTRAPRFEQGELVFFGTPVYAGRVPNLLLPYLKTIQGGGAAAVPVVLFGNRNFDDALIELRDLLRQDGFLPVAAAAVVGEHAFSNRLAAGRPDEADMGKVIDFARNVAAYLRQADQPEVIHVDGTPEPYRGYYQPRDRKQTPIDIRKVKPKTGDACDECGLCATICPMGAINPMDVRQVPGICIKCCACVKRCPQKAKFFDDEGFLYHLHELEEEYARRAEPMFYLPRQ